MKIGWMVLLAGLLPVCASGQVVMPRMYCVMPNGDAGQCKPMTKDGWCECEPRVVPPRLTDTQRQAVEALRREKEHKERDALNLATYTFLGAAAADWTVTAVCLEVSCTDNGGHSTSFWIGGGGFEEPEVALGLGLALDAAIVVGVRQWLAPRSPKWARIVFYSLSGVRMLIAFDKVSDLRQHARRVP